ncbi:MAG: hypothetical protein FJ399_15320 [Verrucomicrobia bacterium]|nr:hypothetical protein [Verrucomicrobiota bacterium]
MKTAIPLSFALLAAGLLPAQAASPPATGALVRGFPRFSATWRPGAAAPIPASRFQVDALAPGGGSEASRSRRAGLEVLSLPPSADWSRPLRGPGRDPLFVSFLVAASESTIVEVGGARLGVTLSPATGWLQFLADAPGAGGLQWRSLGLHAPLERFAGEELVSLPLLTVHLDPAAGVWNLYAGLRLVADNLPLIAGPGIERKFMVRAGHGGAWVCQLIMSDDNPFFEDDNANGIDDSYERQRRGYVLAAGAPVEERRSLAAEWRAQQRLQSPPPLFVRRPVPDRD